MKIKNPELFVKSILIILLIVIGVYISIRAKNMEYHEDTSIPPTITPTNTPLPTATPSPTATPTPISTPIPTNTPTPTIAPRVEVPDIYPELVRRALQEVNGTLDLYATQASTLYNTYSIEELDLLFHVVEAEVTDHCVECKSHVASVIFNRLKAGWLNGDLTKNLLAKRQFEVVTNGRYKKVIVTEETILACEIAFDCDTAQGALFFDSTKGKSWAHRNQEFIFLDHAHWFYK